MLLEQMITLLNLEINMEYLSFLQLFPKNYGAHIFRLVKIPITQKLTNISYGTSQTLQNL